ncbi:MAG: hypothetical protein ABIK65_16425 [Candidatus Eisenbacteria bacterium]
MSRRITPIIVFLLALSVRSAAAEGTRVVHAPPGPVTAGSETEILFTVLGEEKAVSAEVLFRKSAEAVFTAVAADERKGVFRAAVPRSLASPPGFQYFIRVRTGAGEEITSPYRDAEGSPHRVRVMAEGAADRIVVLAPEEDRIVASMDEMMISVLFDPPLLAGDSVFLSLDGETVAEPLEITPDYLLYRPGGALRPGAHEAAVVLLGADGGAGERRWSFFFRDEGERPIDLSLSGKIEAGYARVSSANLRGEPYLPYDETSSLLFDLYAYGDWSGRSVYFSAARDPIYDDETRITARLGGDHLTLEAGDIYPSFSEMTVSWLSGEGGRVGARGRGFESSLFFVRTLPSDTTDGFGTYSQFAAGERLAYSRERWTAAANAVYGWERETSIPDSLRFFRPLKNLVATGSGDVRFLGEGGLHVEAGRSETEGDDTTSAGGWRALLTLLGSPRHRLSVEYHDYRPGFYTLSSPTVDGGERGVIVDGMIRLGTRLRQSLKAEVYEDRETAQEVEEGGKIVQFLGRTDVDWKAGTVDGNTYFLFRTYEIPYESDPYRSRYGTLGLYVRRGATTLSMNGSGSESRSSSRTRTWSGSAYGSGQFAEGRVTWKIGERFSASETVEDTTGSGREVTVSEPTRWTFEAEMGVTGGGLEWRIEYERIDEEDPAEEERYTQHLLSLLAGRRF